MSDEKLTLKGERIAKVIARAGVCSRREAERKIEAGNVSVDGKVIDSPALNVLPSNIIVVDGKALPDKQPPRLWKFHKARGLMTTHKDPEGRPTVFEQLPNGTPRVISVGRLDYNTEGLLLLTNDGELARFLEKPQTGFIRRYRVRVHGRVVEDELFALKEGPVIDGVQYGPVEAVLDVQKGSNAWINISIKEGKNREVRRVMEFLGYEVTRLIRTDYGPLQLGKLPRGEMEEVPRKALAEWFGGKIPGIAATGSGKKEGYANAKDKPNARSPRKSSTKPKDKGRKPHADRRR
ncbi:putative enzyme [Candidatus Terasakiella magnetica]|uniref:Pseudouridine synthase n=1 Tax=Candidatus Terasakiella magnetica TaxID=1867952 RepID=A0A1C3RIY8_9PROT|nr:pseudouridine synthase [Candidatus Terasakiella magnetica]SCA57224.1 putative enzyme [Candidatus Terasakiella magnetica]